MKSLFFVSSPLELICAIEARRQFKTENSILVLYLFDKDKPIIEYIMSLSNGWQEIYRPYRDSINYGKRWLIMLKKIKKQEYEYLFTTGMTFASHFLFNIKYKKYYFLDDGTLTLRNVSHFKKKGSLSNHISLFLGENKLGLKYKWKEFSYYFLGHKHRGILNKLNLFTFFDIPKSKNIDIVRNKLLWFNQIRIKNVYEPLKNTVYVIGTPLVKENILNKKYYNKLMFQIKKYFISKNIIYIPHRWETEADIKNIRNNFGFKIRPNKYIIELDFIKTGIIPESIVGTISTALFTLKYLYPKINFYNIKLDKSEINPANKESVEAIIEYQKGMFHEI